jgi:hypothetical protein
VAKAEKLKAQLAAAGEKRIVSAKIMAAWLMAKRNVKWLMAAIIS